MSKKIDYNLIVQCLAEGEIKQQDIARLAGVPQSMVSQISRGKTMPWLQGPIRAARARLGKTSHPIRELKKPQTELERARQWVMYAYARYLWNYELADEPNVCVRFVKMIVKSAKPIVDEKALLKLYRQIRPNRRGQKNNA